MNFIDKNFNNLKKYQNLQLKVENIGGGCSIELSKDNFYIAKVEKENKALYIGSKYNNKTIIDGFLEKYDLEDGEAVYVVIGFGLGYHIEELLKRSGNANKIIVFEPNEELFIEALKVRDLTEIISDNRINIYLYKNENKTMEALNNTLNLSYPNYIYCNVFSSYEKLYGEETITVIRVVENYMLLAKATAYTNSLFKETVLKNYFNNFVNIAKGNTGEEFQDKFSGKTAVVVSSGPSLSKNIHLLKEYQKDFILISAGRSLKELLDNGITPHFICTVDPGEIMYQLMQPVINEKIPMVCVDQVNNNLIGEYKGEKIFVLKGLKEVFGKLIGKNYISLPAGGSVAHLCTSFAGYLGVKNIIFIGQDLAYTNNQYHSQSSSNEKLIGSAASINNTENFYVPGNVEEKVLTSKVFYIFKTWFEMFIEANKQIHFINATEGGAKINGCEVMSFEEAHKRLSQGEIDVKSKVDEILSINEKIKIASLKNNLNKFTSKLESLKEKSKQGIKLYEKMLEYYEFNKKVSLPAVFSKLDTIDAVFAGETEISSLINLCAYDEMKEISLNRTFREKNGESEREKGIRISKRGIAIYRSNIKGIEMILEQLSILKTNLEGMRD